MPTFRLFATILICSALAVLLTACRQAAPLNESKQATSDSESAVPDPSSSKSGTDTAADAVVLDSMPVKLPTQNFQPGYAGSQACSECHESEYHSWHGSFHRSMTQVVTPKSMAAPIDDVYLASRGREYHFWEEAGEYWVEMVDPDWDLENKLQGVVKPSNEGPRVKRRIVMSTGSHHYQTYWVNGKRGNHLWQIPWIYHLEKQRWLPAEDAFLTPPVDYHRQAEWNDNCLTCHATHASTQYDASEDRFGTMAAELGISCESCHGPAQKHIELHRAKAANPEAAAVVEPALSPSGLDHQRSADVCGQCHSFHMLTSPLSMQNGLVFRPGDKLTDHRTLFSFDDEFVRSKVELIGGFWGDGTVRLAGREYSGMILSDCFQHGELSCTSCHSMHNYESPEDQLRPGFRSDEACLQCHTSMANDIPAHTHHAAESSGSRCYNCHMPHTSFGLFKAMRSHRIDSPTAAMTPESPRPNACNLCHNDQSLSWTASHLTDWYGQPQIKTNAFMDAHSISAVFLLSGDAVQRAVMAWNMGRKESMDASGSSWQVPLLAELLNDPYAMVRNTAWEALQNFPIPKSIQYDYIAAESRRVETQQALLEFWKSSRELLPEERRQRVLQMADGNLNTQLIQQLLKAQDRRPIILPE